MKVKIEFEVNADFDKVLKCVYDRVDSLYYELLDIDNNFKDMNVVITTHHNKIDEGTPHINFHNTLPITKPFDLYGEFCDMFHNGTCWGTRDREKCGCGGLKQFCTHYPKG